MSKQFYFKQFSLAWVHSLVRFDPLKDPIRCYLSKLEWSWKWWQWRGTPHSPKIQYYWNLTIKLFRVITRTFVGRRVLSLFRDAAGVFYSPSRLGSSRMENVFSLISEKYKRIVFNRTLETNIKEGLGKTFDRNNWYWIINNNCTEIEKWKILHAELKRVFLKGELSMNLLGGFENREYEF